MRKILGKAGGKRKKRNKQREELDWLDFDEEEDEDAYYEDDEIDEDAYYEDDEEDEDAYYEDDEEDEDAYYEDDEEDEDAYYEDDEEDEDAYYEDDEEDEDAYYEDDEEDEDAYYEDDEDEDEAPTGIRRVAAFFMNMSMVDHIVMFTGLMVLILAGVTGTMYAGAKLNERQIATFAEVGEGIDGIPIIGESGLVAVSDAQASKAVAAELEALEAEANQVDEATGKIQVVLNMTSIQRDLKIKFANKKSGKLIPNVAFEVEVVNASGKDYVLKDEDKDGIIYEKDIEPGKYKVKITGPAGLSDYGFSEEAVTVTVKDNIEYKKVDVADEIKTEAQINAKAEDTKVNETVVESANKDTVEWVESTKTLIEGTEETSERYEQITRKEITDPEEKAAIGFRLLVEGDETEEDENGESGIPTPTPEESAPTPTLETVPTPTPEVTSMPTEAPEPTGEKTPTPIPSTAPTESPDATPVATPSTTPGASPVVTPSATPVVTPSASPTATPSATPTATPSASPTATPSASPTATPNSARNDTESNLKSNSGDKLYVKISDGNFREAKYADFYNDDIKVFYRKVKETNGKYRYTGWQTLDGVTYFFDKNGNKVTGEQVIQGAKYSFNSDGSLNTGSGQMGIDVSKWNGNIDWKAVKNSGVSYVIIRCGYRGSTTGALIEDPMFRANIQGAQNAGLKVGVYFFTQAVSEVEAVEEASMVLGLIKGYNISFPVFLDVEATSGNNGRADRIDAGTRTAVCRAFCQTVQNSGYKAGIYANKTWFNSYIDTPSLTGYKIWLAQYAASPTYNRTKYDMWQYSSKGRVSGISGDVDMNISYMGY